MIADSWCTDSPKLRSPWARYAVLACSRSWRQGSVSITSSPASTVATTGWGRAAENMCVRAKKRK
ncbi:hypothetical protein D3C72_2135550 [compost metagenome]